MLDAGGVHGDVGDVAEEAEPAAVGRQVDCLGDCCAVEEHRVGAVLALDRVAAVARVPDERVVAGAEQGHVVAAVAVDRVVAGAAEQRLRSGASEQAVVSVAAVDRRRDRVRERPVALVDAHEVVSRPRIDGDPRDLLALEAEVGRAVVADVDLEVPGSRAFRRSAILSCRLRALDHQRAVLELRVLEARVLGVVGASARRSA